MTHFDKKHLVSIKEASSIFGVSEATVYNWIKTGYLKKESGLIPYEHINSLLQNINNGTLNKLRSRANKSNNEDLFIPEKYLSVKATNSLKFIIEEFLRSGMDVDKIIDIFLIKILINSGVVNIAGDRFVSDKNSVKEELESFKIAPVDLNLLQFDFADISTDEDIAGLLYQSIIKGGIRSDQGAFYTPQSVVQDIISKYAKTDSFFLDPCCGTGQFLIKASKVITQPANIYGYDIDPIAVKIARINLILAYPENDFIPNVFCINSLIDLPLIKGTKFVPFEGFDIVATNPPWGALIDNQSLGILNNRFPEIASGETASYFLLLGLKLLASNGVLSYILPDSLMNVKTHSDIRKIIASNYSIKNVYSYGNLFTRVFSKVVRIDLQNNSVNETEITVTRYYKNQKIEYFFKQSEWMSNYNHIFDYETTPDEKRVLDKIFAADNFSIQSKAKWALGIVTGNNSKFIIDTMEAGTDPILTGKEIKPYKYLEPAKYIKFSADLFQQSAPLSFYKANPKLIYKFISDKLIFSYDDKGVFTLNSANIVIIEGSYSMKVYAALFNSPLYSFVFKKKFNSIKVLRSHIESLPIPVLSHNQETVIERYFDRIVDNDTNAVSELNKYIYGIFEINSEEVLIIEGTKDQ